MRKILIENSDMSLLEYTHEDDCDMYACWRDDDTQRAFNFIFTESFEEFCDFTINEYPLFATIFIKSLNKTIGVVRLSPDVVNPDLAIWVYKPYRGLTYGTKAFHLAVRYCFTNLGLAQVFAGCYEDNSASLKMLEKLNFRRDPTFDTVETSAFNQLTIRQLAFKVERNDFK